MLRAQSACVCSSARLVASMPDVRSAIGLGRRLSVLPWRRGDEEEEVTTCLGYHKNIFYDIGEIY